MLVIYKPKSLNGFRRRSESYSAFDDYRVERSDDEIVLKPHLINWRRNIRLAVLIAACSLSIGVWMHWQGPKSVRERVITTCIGVVVSACPIVMPIVRRFAIHQTLVTANVRTRKAAIVDDRTQNFVDQVRRGIGLSPKAKPSHFSVSFDEIVGFCDVLEKFADNYTELQVIVGGQGEPKCHLIAAMGYTDFYHTRHNVFTPLAQTLAREIGVPHYSIDLSLGTIFKDGESVPVVEWREIPI